MSRRRCRRERSAATTSPWSGRSPRLTTQADDLSSRIGPGSWYLVAYLLWAVALFGLWRARRGRSLDPLELGVLVLVLLLAGPLSWDHYFVWAVLPIVLLADPARWRGRRPLETGALLAGLGAALLLCRRGAGAPVARRGAGRRPATRHDLSLHDRGRPGRCGRALAPAPFADGQSRASRMYR